MALNSGVSDLAELIRSMDPVINPGVFVFASVPDLATVPSSQLIAMIREQEGVSVIVSEADAIALGLPILFRAAWISLNVHSDLQAVGLTAAFSTALGQAGISCNVVAGALHDHIFVPVAAAELAMSALRGLQQGSAAQPTS